jgi:hypothetical protein
LTAPGNQITHESTQRGGYPGVTPNASGAADFEVYEAEAEAQYGSADNR